MKTRNTLALVLGMGLSLPFAAPAKTVEQSYLESCRRGPGIPVPIRVVAPQIGSGDIGQTIVLGFVVDARGLPKNLSVQSGSDRWLAASAMRAVRKWRFAPVLRDGAPVETKVVLPIRVIDRQEAGQGAAFE